MKTPKDARIVVVRTGGDPTLLTSYGPKVALLVSQDAQEATIRYRCGTGYHPRLKRVPASAVLRDATPRERTLGYVP